MNSTTLTDNRIIVATGPKGDFITSITIFDGGNFATATVRFDTTVDRRTYMTGKASFSDAVAWAALQAYKFLNDRYAYLFESIKMYGNLYDDSDIHREIRAINSVVDMVLSLADQINRRMKEKGSNLVALLNKFGDVRLSEDVFLCEGFDPVLYANERELLLGMIQVNLVALDVLGTVILRGVEQQ